MARHFTLDEARALLPRIGAIASEMRDLKAEFNRHRAAELLLSRGSGEDGEHLHEAQDQHHAESVRLARAIEQLIAEVEALGAEIKGIDEGLVDFPAERDGRTVYLCWKLDEPDIAWWHDLTSGFRGRQPL
jgi:hypothetical protein